MDKQQINKPAKHNIVTQQPLRFLMWCHVYIT